MDKSRSFVVRTTPNARSDAINVAQRGGAAILVVHTTATPEQGDANKAVLALIAKALDCPRSSLSILRGHSSRHKIVRFSED